MGAGRRGLLTPICHCLCSVTANKAGSLLHETSLQAWLPVKPTKKQHGTMLTLAKAGCSAFMPVVASASSADWLLHLSTRTIAQLIPTCPRAKLIAFDSALSCQALLPIISDIRSKSRGYTWSPSSVRKIYRSSCHLSTEPLIMYTSS